MKNDKKILVVDDDKDLCNLISEIIKEAGFEVKKAYDGNTALNKIIMENYDAMIIDNKLSGISGISVIEQTKHFNPSLKTIMISAYGNTNTKLKAKDLGVYDFLDKPFDIKVLLSRIKDLFFNTNGSNFTMIY
jgi:DNA-binding response OmpR family regulator